MTAKSTLNPIPPGHASAPALQPLDWPDSLTPEELSRDLDRALESLMSCIGVGLPERVASRFERLAALDRCISARSEAGERIPSSAWQWLMKCTTTTITRPGTSVLAEGLRRLLAENCAATVEAPAVAVTVEASVEPAEGEAAR